MDEEDKELKDKITKERIVRALEGKKKFDVLFKFSDVVWEIEAKDKEEAEIIADDYLWNKKTTPKSETYCYGIEVDEVNE